VVILDSDRRIVDSDEAQQDPPMSEFHKELLASLRRVFGWPYQVLKVMENVTNDTGLSWNPDFWVEKNGKKILVIGTLDPSTTITDFDQRMRSAFAIMSSNWFYKGKIALSANRSVLIMPDGVSKELTHERYLPYHYMFENVGCEIVRQADLIELELYRDDEDRERNPIKWARPDSSQISRRQP
jgi:hypothetical protein